MTCTNPVKFKFRVSIQFKGTQSSPPLQPASSGCSHGRRAGLSRSRQEATRRPHIPTVPHAGTAGGAQCKLQTQGRRHRARVPYAVGAAFYYLSTACQNKAKSDFKCCVSKEQRDVDNCAGNLEGKALCTHAIMPSLCQRATACGIGTPGSHREC